MNIFNSKDKLNLFLHSKSSFDILSGVNIILSPEFYWVRKFDLPMASTKEVLSALPSLFEEFIDVTDKKFYVKKLEDKRYLCFAYDEQNIISGIKNANLSLSQINSIHFAQIELESIVDTSVQVCMKVSGVCLGFSNNILVQVPLQLQVNTNNDIDISSMKLSKYTISVSQSSKYITEKNSYLLSGIVVLFSLMLFIKVFINNNIVSSVPMQIDNIKQKYNMPSSTIQANSIMKKLNKISDKQIILREAYKYIFNFKSKYGGTMISCNYKNKSFIIKFKNIKAKVLVDYLEKKIFTYKCCSKR